MAQQVFGPAAVVSVLNRAFTNTSPSNAVFANQVATAGNTDASQLAFAKSFGAQFAVGKTAADLSALLMTNMGLDNALLAAALTDYIAANGTENVGIIAWQLSSILSNLENDATYGAAAMAWNAEVTDAYQYSSDVTNTVPSSGGTSGNEAPKNFVLTVDQDVRTGGAGADFFRGVAGRAVGSQEQSTFNSSDILDGGAGNDSLILNLVGNYDGGARVKGIENLVLGTNIAAAAFDYNVNAGSNEITDVTTIVADQINGGEALTVRNIVRTDAAGAKVAPTLSWVNDSNTQAAGVVNYTYRAAELTGAADEQKVSLKSVNNGDINLSAGFETISITSVGTEQVTLQPGVDNVVADVTSGASLRTVNLAGTAEIGKNAGVTVAGLTDRFLATDNGGVTGSTAATSSNLLSVAEVVTKVDASTAEAAVNVRFVNTDATGTNVTFLGGAGNDYVEFELGNISANGGAGNDTFAFINAGANSTFGEGDSIDGGAGSDTIQIGVNGVGIYNISETELRNKTSIGEIDLRGAESFLTLSSDFVSKADTADSITVRTNKISQTSLTVADNAATTGVANALEDQSEHTVNLSKLSANQAVNYIGGSGSDRIILNDATFNVLKTLDGGEYSPTSAAATFSGYDTITVVTNGENVVIDAQDLSNVRNFEGFVLTKNSAAATYNITMTRAFLNANTEAIDNATNTTNVDTTFHIGTSAAANNSRLGAGDIVNIDIRDLLTAADAANAGTRRLDLGSLIASGATINLIGNLATYTPATVPAGILNNNTADHLAIVRDDAAFPGQNVLDTTIGVDGVDGAVLARTIETSQATLQAWDTVLGGAQALHFNGAVGNLNVSNVAGAPFQNVTNIAAINLDNGVANSVTITNDAMFAATLAINGGDGVDAFTSTGAAVNGLTAGAVITGNNGADSLVVDAVNAAHNLGNLTANVESVTLNGTAGQDLSANFGGGANAIVLGATTTTLTVSNSGAAMAAVDLSANAAATVVITNNNNVTFAAANIVGVTNLTVNVSSDVTGATVDFSGVTAAAGTPFLPTNTTVTLGAANAVKDVVNVTGVSTIANISNVVAIENFEAGAGADQINVTTGGGTVYTLNLANTNVGTFLGDVNTQIAAVLGAGYTDVAGDVIVLTVTGSGALNGTYAISDVTAGALLDGAAEVVKLVGLSGTLAAADFV